MRRRSRFLAGALAFCMTLSAVAWDGNTISAQAKGKMQNEEWDELSAMLDQYPGIYTKDTKLGTAWNNDCSPDGPLMGNGTVYAFMDPASRKAQNIYISRSDMWTEYQQEGNTSRYGYSTLGQISVEKANISQNLALNKTVAVSGQKREDVGGAKLVDGSISKADKWYATKEDSQYRPEGHYWAVVDLGKEQEITRWVVHHAEAGGEGANVNTRDFQLQYTNKENPDNGNDEDWITIDTVEGNTEAVTDRNLSEAVQTRYVRLLVTKPAEKDTSIRICEFELYNSKKGETTEFIQREDMKNAEVTAQSEDGFTLRNYVAAKENVLVTEITNITNKPIDIEITAGMKYGDISAKVDNNIMSATRTGGFDNKEEYDVELTMSSCFVDSESVKLSKFEQGENKAELTLEPNQTIKMVTAIEGGRQIKNSIDMAYATLEKVKGDLDGLNQEHRA